MINKTDVTIETYNNIVNEYIDYYKSKDLGGKVQFQREIDYICQRLKDDAKILDVGTAIGDYPKYLTEKMKTKKYDVIGIDASSNMIKIASENAPKANFKLMDVRKMDFDDNTFDAIICFATLIHVNDDECEKILYNFDKILKKDGIIAINVYEWLDNEKELFEPEPFNPKFKTYFNKYKRDFFINFFKNNNYKILTFFDNPLFNSSKIKGKTSDINQFSIIVKK